MVWQGISTILNKTCLDKLKMRAYFTIFLHENKDKIAQMLSLLLVCQSVQASFRGQDNIDKRERGEMCDVTVDLACK